MSEEMIYIYILMEVQLSFNMRLFEVISERVFSFEGQVRSPRYPKTNGWNLKIPPKGKGETSNVQKPPILGVPAVSFRGCIWCIPIWGFLWCFQGHWTVFSFWLWQTANVCGTAGMMMLTRANEGGFFRVYSSHIYLFPKLVRLMKQIEHIHLIPETSTSKWLFQLDDSKSLHQKWRVSPTHPLNSGCLGFQSSIFTPKNVVPLLPLYLGCVRKKINDWNHGPPNYPQQNYNPARNKGLLRGY